MIVSVAEAVRNLDHYGQLLFDCQFGLPGNQSRQIVAAQEFYRYVAGLSLPAEGEDGRDIWMVQSGGCPALAVKPRLEFFVPPDAVTENPEGDKPVAVPIKSFVYETQMALSQLFEQRVFSERAGDILLAGGSHHSPSYAYLLQ